MGSNPDRVRGWQHNGLGRVVVVEVEESDRDDGHGCLHHPRRHSSYSCWGSLLIQQNVQQARARRPCPEESNVRAVPDELVRGRFWIDRASMFPKLAIVFAGL